MKEVPLQPIGVPLVVAHLRWVVALAMLRAAERPQTNQHLLTEIRKFVDRYKLNDLFTGNPHSLRLDWKIFFQSHRNKTLPPFIPSVDDCAAFYGVRLPHNTSKRLALLLDQGDSQRTAPTDPLIVSWGTYAAKLVEENNGWEEFASATSLERIKDVWPAPQLRMVQHAGEADSFTQRILHLFRHRYVQVLTSTVGVLWPFWLLANRRWTTFLRKVELAEGKSFHVGPRLPSGDSQLFLDVYIKVGDFDGLPYPFGHADTLLRRGIAEHHEETAYERYLGSPWPAEAVGFVREALSKEAWCPPLLLPGRAPEFGSSDNSEPNRATAVFTISRPCESFASSYGRIVSVPKTDPLRVVYEPRTWAERAVNSLGKVFPVPLTRQQMLQSFAEDEADVVLSYFPVDLLIQANPQYSRLSPHEIFSLFRERGTELLQPFPATVIGCGAGLIRQTGMRQLILDLLAYVHKTYSVFHHLQPDQSILRPKFERLRHASLEDKRTHATSIEERCHSSSSTSPLWRRRFVGESTIRDWMTEALLAMINAVGQGNTTQLEIYVREWGWALLQEYVDYTWLFVSHDLIDKRSQK